MRFVDITDEFCSDVEPVMADDITSVCASAATRCRDFSPKAREFVPLAATLADGSMLMCASRGEKIDAKSLSRQVTADVREAAKVTFWANPLLWLELGRMVWRVIQYLMTRRGG